MSGTIETTKATATRTMTLAHRITVILTTTAGTVIITTMARMPHGHGDPSPGVDPLPRGAGSLKSSSSTHSAALLAT